MSASRDQPPRSGRSLPRGRHGLPRAVVVANQRERIFDSLAAVCAAKGYADVTVRDITEHAGVSRRTFYDLFADKEQCFLAAHDVIVERLFRVVRAAYAAGDRPWPARLASGLRALVELSSSEPNLARLAIVDVLAAGQQALARRDAALRRFAVFFEPGRMRLPAAMEAQELLAEAVIGGLYEAMYAYLRDGQPDQLREVVPDLLYCALVPYLGHVEAIAARDAERAGGSVPS